jgi:hypothetical protein
MITALNNFYNSLLDAYQSGSWQPRKETTIKAVDWTKLHMDNLYISHQVH